MSFEFDLRYTVVHFRLRIQRGGDTLFDSETKEAALSDEMLHAMAVLAIGDVIRISDIQAMDPTGKLLELRSLRLEVEE